MLCRYRCYQDTVVVNKIPLLYNDDTIVVMIRLF